jgi:benzylsuccinate CoA-transferase BbsE subunit
MKKNFQQKGLLSGIQILDLADEKASFGSKLMADLGARVIKIEKPGGDSSRKIGPFINNTPDPENSLSFFYNNIGKLGITLDIELPEGKKLFLKLVEQTDILVETFSPGYLKKLGMDFESLSRINPKLIMVSVTGFGQTGPKKGFRSCDLVASAYGGQMCLSGFRSSAPLKPFGEQSFFAGSLFAATGVVLALRKRRQTGKGEHIDISLQEAVASTLEHVMVRFFYENMVSKRQGDQNRNNDFYIMPCKDGFMQITIFQQWETIVEWMDSKGMAGDLMDDKYRDEEFRKKNRDHIIDVIQRWTRTHTVDELFENGQIMGFPWAPVCSPYKVSESPQLKERDFFKSLKHSKLDTMLKYPGMPYRFGKSNMPEPKPAPIIGEDNDRVYREDLGLSVKEMQRLKSNNVI